MKPKQSKIKVEKIRLSITLLGRIEKIAKLAGVTRTQVINVTLATAIVVADDSVMHRKETQLGPECAR